MRIFQKTEEFKDRIKKGELLDKILPDVTTVREASKELEMNATMMFN